MSALFHSYLCGRNAAEWLIPMKNKENLREKQVNLRLTQAEYERLTRTAQDHGIGRAAYLRMVLRGAWLREDGRKSE